MYVTCSMVGKCELFVGCQMLIPIQMGQSSPKKASEANESFVTAANKAAAATANKPKRTGSLALFFRKVSTFLSRFITTSIILSVFAGFKWLTHCGTKQFHCIEL